ncbi:uncharacterized protein LOC127242018 [Andrographis paniculata]|uniref:uncharacterized protein LOC127242018 n=1 Tax=Andrographis paniculata TaxID=175694 RepID=UPI0021E8E646|nr:uncharacterized protein LOC127242018 [Andrographis paniculata]
MTIEVFPDSPSRISFSYDLSQSDDVVPVEEHIRTTSSSAIDFDFCVFRESFDRESSTADELFFNGQILPIEIKRRLSPPPQPQPSPAPRPPPPPPPPRQPTPPKNANAAAAAAADSPEEKQRSFWRFKRSSSLNCGSGYGRTLCPLPLLSRSNSTGSSAAAARSANNPKFGFLKPSSQKKSPFSRSPLKRTGHRFPASSAGVKFSPVLHVPSANLFGLGSIFSTGTSTSKKKQ